MPGLELENGRDLRTEDSTTSKDKIRSMEPPTTKALRKRRRNVSLASRNGDKAGAASKNLARRRTVSLR